MNSLINELILVICVSLALVGVMDYLLGAEISYEPQYAELNVSLGEDTTYNSTIKNIGSQDVDVRFSAEGINHIAINFVPASDQIERGATKLIHIHIDTKSAISGDQKGFIYIWNNKIENNGNTQDVLEKIPITIRVINSSKCQSDRTIHSLRTKNFYHHA